MLYKAYSKKERTFTTKTLFYNILSTVPFKVVPSTGDTPFPTFLPLLECFWNALSVVARSSLIAFSLIPACSKKKTELFKYLANQHRGRATATERT
jgi:hypothetical protein